MSRTETAKAVAAEERPEETRSFVRVKAKLVGATTLPEEKIRVLEGFRREVTVSDLCRREGIKPHSYYAWTKEFMEAGRERLTRDMVRDATQQEVQALRRENVELKQMVADLSPGGAPSEKNSYTDTPRRRRYQRMSAAEKAEVLVTVASSPTPKLARFSESLESPGAPTTGA